MNPVLKIFFIFVSVPRQHLIISKDQWKYPSPSSDFRALFTNPKIYFSYASRQAREAYWYGFLFAMEIMLCARSARSPGRYSNTCDAIFQLLTNFKIIKNFIPTETSMFSALSLCTASALLSVSPPTRTYNKVKIWLFCYTHGRF